MPANLTPEYLQAEARFKAAREPRERIEALTEMMRVIPKHKGTDHLRGQLRKKLSQLKEEARTVKKKAAKRVDPGHVPRQGAGQVVLLGAPNAGKSALVAALTNAEPEIAPYPFTTRKPLPAMMYYEDVPIQLVDGPAVDPVVYEPWLATLFRNADLAIVALNPAQVGVLEGMDTISDVLTRSRTTLAPAWWAVGREEGEGDGEEGTDDDEELDDEVLLARLEPGEVELPTLVAVTKMDQGQNREGFEVLNELLGQDWPFMPVSAESGEGLDALRRAVFDALKVIRVYAKPPGKPPSMKVPIVLPRGATVRDLAVLIHKEIADSLQYARIWSERHFDGQRIPRDHVLEDRDVVEIHA